MKSELTPHIETIKKLYQEGLSTTKIGNIFNKDPETVRVFLHRNNIKVRSREEACTKYTLDKTFFDRIDTEEKAYWLGFLTADGGIVAHELVLSLKAADLKHINAFRGSLKSSHPIKTVTHVINGKSIKQPRLVISSMPIINSLKKLGVTERKSLTVKPAIITKELQPAYWRGYFDGDGHINLTETARNVELTGNQYMLHGFAIFLEEKTGIKSNLQKHKSVYRLRYSKRSKVFSIAKLLYSSSKIHLQRKYDVAEKIFKDEFFLLRKNSSQRIKPTSSQANSSP